MRGLTTWYLEMLDQAELQAKVAPEGFEVSIRESPDAEWNRCMYQKVGADWEWVDRLKWSDSDWHNYVFQAEMTTGEARLDGKTAGYFELEAQEGGDVEVIQLGLLPECIGKGLGGAMVTMALETAWSLPGTRRVWLHTCTRDHQRALDNYKRRGLKVYHTEVDGDGGASSRLPSPE